MNIEPKLPDSESDYSLQTNIYENAVDWAELQAEMDEALLWEL